MIVVDTNVVAYFFIEGTRTLAARALRRDDPDWRLPPLWRHEFLNVLATFTRQRGAGLDKARALWQAATRMLADREHDVDMAAALGMAVKKKISAYDAQFVLLAQTLKVRLVTEDLRLLKLFPSLTQPLTRHLPA